MGDNLVKATAKGHRLDGPVMRVNNNPGRFQILNRLARQNGLADPGDKIFAEVFVKDAHSNKSLLENLREVMAKLATDALRILALLSTATEKS